jgi:hypothetical protein
MPQGLSVTLRSLDLRCGLLDRLDTEERGAFVPQKP